ncbi:MerR family transcriptional regulator [Alkaliphilus sp. B6464]|uniref:MerR family transcriptional regulator n=1 Tax=Alkaliphilus sp. B6464 TaxID=2731219 RepID=UPI001BA4E18E|nr:MerR family transcriptional regulator [Alkaliphilus sp. B6464]QUH19265.1 MerR family transcriptional regulator [Alkaliphilus sp. B6464]
MKKEYLTIGELAKQMGVTVRTLQYYDNEQILKPSKLSEGGRRLYSSKDIIKLHQILSFKYLGFSLDDIKNQILKLDTPNEVINVLEHQKSIIKEQLENLNEALNLINSLQSEIQNIQEVNFQKYSEIIELLRLGNKNYWVWKILDNTLTEHIKSSFSDTPDLGEELIQEYLKLVDITFKLKNSNVSVKSDESMKLAKLWWKLILDFTGGNMDLIPSLMNFNNEVSGGNYELSKKQNEINEYLGELLAHYFKINKISINENL